MAIIFTDRHGQSLPFIPITKSCNGDAEAETLGGFQAGRPGAARRRATGGKGHRPRCVSCLEVSHDHAYRIRSCRVIFHLRMGVSGCRPPRCASVLAKIDISEQRMYVYVDGAQIRDVAGFDRVPGATARRPARSVLPFCDGCTIRRNMTARRCLIRCSSTGATRSTVRTSSAIWAGALRMAAYACIPATLPVLFNLVSRHGASRTRIVVSH